MRNKEETLDNILIPSAGRCANYMGVATDIASEVFRLRVRYETMTFCTLSA